MVRLGNDACAFAYRDSLFKREGDHYVVTAVEFALSRTPALKLEYAGIGEELLAMGIRSPSASHVAEAVIRIRQRKLPDPAVLGNAGSFFKNPVVSSDQRTQLLGDHPQLVSHVQPDGRYKLAAGWLIDQCGWKGRNVGAAGVYEKQALVLVNRGQASGQDIVHLAELIQRDVQARFHVRLEPEPLFV